jgi:hypothetical protein
MAPCGGSFGLPKAISLFTGAAFAVAMLAAATSPPTAPPATTSRLDITVTNLVSAAAFGWTRTPT